MIQNLDLIIDLKNYIITETVSFPTNKPVYIPEIIINYIVYFNLCRKNNTLGIRNPQDITNNIFTNGRDNQKLHGIVFYNRNNTERRASDMNTSTNSFYFIPS